MVPTISPPRPPPIRCDGGQNTTSLDELLELLTVKRRRFLLYTLKRNNNDVFDIETLARLAAADHADTPPDNVPNGLYTHYLTHLHHTDLPQLKEFGLIDYDRRSETVIPDANPPLLDALLELIQQYEDRDTNC